MKINGSGTDLSLLNIRGRTTLTVLPRPDWYVSQATPPQIRIYHRACAEHF